MIANLIQSRADDLFGSALGNGTIQSHPRHTKVAKEVTKTTAPAAVNNPTMAAKSPAENTWATVVKNAPSNLPARPPAKKTKATAQRDISLDKKIDSRIMIRLATDSSAFKLSTKALLDSTKEALGDEMAKDVQTVSLVRSGLAVHPTSIEAKGFSP